MDLLPVLALEGLGRLSWLAVGRVSFSGQVVGVFGGALQSLLGPQEAGVEHFEAAQVTLQVVEFLLLDGGVQELTEIADDGDCGLRRGVYVFV